MAEYELTPDAENDLREIARYTTRTWGVAQTRKYKAALLRGFTGIAKECHRYGLRSLRD